LCRKCLIAPSWTRFWRLWPLSENGASQLLRLLFVDFACVALLLTRASASTPLNPKLEALRPLHPLHLLAAATLPLSLKVLYCVARGRRYFFTVFAAYDALLAEFMPPVIAAAQSIKNAGKWPYPCLIRLWRHRVPSDSGTGLIKQTSLLAEAFAEQRRMVGLHYNSQHSFLVFIRPLDSSPTFRRCSWRRLAKSLLMPTCQNFWRQPPQKWETLKSAKTTAATSRNTSTQLLRAPVIAASAQPICSLLTISLSHVIALCSRPVLGAHGGRPRPTGARSLYHRDRESRVVTYLLLPTCFLVFRWVLLRCGATKSCPSTAANRATTPRAMCRLRTA
jgi:hypothetical protein